MPHRVAFTFRSRLVAILVHHRRGRRRSAAVAPHSQGPHRPARFDGDNEGTLRRKVIRNRFTDDAETIRRIGLRSTYQVSEQPTPQRD